MYIKNHSNTVQTSYDNLKVTVIAWTFRVVGFVCFVALYPKSTAMVMAGRSFHLTKLFSGQA